MDRCRTLRSCRGTPTAQGVATGPAAYVAPIPAHGRKSVLPTATALDDGRVREGENRWAELVCLRRSDAAGAIAKAGALPGPVTVRPVSSTEMAG